MELNIINEEADGNPVVIVEGDAGKVCEALERQDECMASIALGAFAVMHQQGISSTSIDLRNDDNGFIDSKPSRIRAELDGNGEPELLTFSFLDTEEEPA